jgi:hypothetical protein
MEKVCTKCNVSKVIDEFYKRNNGIIASECKKCHRSYCKIYAMKNKEKLIERSKIWQSEHKEERKIIKKKWIEKNPDYHKQYRDQYYKDNPNYNKDQYWKDPNKYREASKMFRKNNPKHNQNYQKIRCSYDTNFRLIRNLRSRMSYALNNNKNNKTIMLLGCTVPDLRVYLESKFLPTMSWENYGRTGWHIDHIIPCSSFNFTNKDEQLKCFHYTNLQPLFATTKIIDGVTYIGNTNKNNKII